MPGLHRVLLGSVLSAAFLLLPQVVTAQRVSALLPQSIISSEWGCFSLRCFMTVADFDGTTAALVNTGYGVALAVRDANGQWLLQQQMQNPDEPGSFYAPVPFGGPLAVRGNTLFVSGSSSKYNWKSVIYVWTRSGSAWANTQVLAVPRPAGFDNTELRDIVLQGNTAAVSGVRVATGTDTVLAQIDIYGRQADGRYARRAQINPPTGQNSLVGYGLALEGNRLLVADPTAFGGSGCVYVYEFGTSGWSLRNRLQASDASAGARFGTSLSLSGNTIAVSAPNRPNFDNPLHPGAIYTFQRTTRGWAQTQILVKPEFPPEFPDEESSAPFGNSVALSGDRLIAEWGSPTEPGLAYLFERRGVWAPVATLDMIETYLYSRTVLLSGTTAIVNANDEAYWWPGLSYELPGLWTLPPRLPPN